MRATTGTVDNICGCWHTGINAFQTCCIRVYGIKLPIRTNHASNELTDGVNQIEVGLVGIDDVGEYGGLASFSAVFAEA